MNFACIQITNGIYCRNGLEQQRLVHAALRFLPKYHHSSRVPHGMAIRKNKSLCPIILDHKLSLAYIIRVYLFYAVQEYDQNQVGHEVRIIKLRRTGVDGGPNKFRVHHPGIPLETKIVVCRQQCMLRICIILLYVVIECREVSLPCFLFCVVHIELHCHSRRDRKEVFKMVELLVIVGVK